MAAMPTSAFPRSLTDDSNTRSTEALSDKRQADGPSLESHAANLVGKIDEVLTALKDRDGPPQTLIRQGQLGGVEARIAHLEASTAHLARDVAQIRTDVRDIRERLYRLQERAAQLPSRGSLAVTLVLVIAALIGASAFEQQIRGFILAAF
jgi:hypothetical protein